MRPPMGHFCSSEGLRLAFYPLHADGIVSILLGIDKLGQLKGLGDMNGTRSITLAVTMILALVAVSGCYEPEPTPLVVGIDQPVVMPEPTPVPKYRLVGHSVKGTPIRVEVLGEGYDTTMIIATIHGNEPAGTPLVHKLSEHLKANPDLLSGRQIVIMDVANPDGMAADTRENARAVDLNRNFETTNRVNNANHGQTPLSEPESRAIQTAILQYSPDRIISIHQPLNCIDYDGPGKALAMYMARQCPLPVKKLGARAGSLGSYTGEDLKIPTITVELPQSASQLADELLWKQYGPMMMAGITYNASK